MKPMTGVQVTVDRNIDKLFLQIDKELRYRVERTAMHNAAKLIKETMEKKVPDGWAPNTNPSVADKTPTRAKQSAKSKARFPTHMKDHVGIKTKTSNFGVLKIVGVTSRANHVNFDHGEKARTVGRDHVLWGFRDSPPRMRRQLVDIAAEVQQMHKDRIYRMIVEQIRIELAKIRLEELRKGKKP